MRGLGRHVLVDFFGCNPEILDDLEFIKRAMLDAVEACGATIIGSLEKKFEPQGVTVIVGISESHLTIHTWPEHGCAAFDIFTCSPEMDWTKAVELLRKRLAASRQEINPEVVRLPVSRLRTSASPGDG